MCYHRVFLRLDFLVKSSGVINLIFDGGLIKCKNCGVLSGFRTGQKYHRLYLFNVRKVSFLPSPGLKQIVPFSSYSAVVEEWLGADDADPNSIDVGEEPVSPFCGLSTEQVDEILGSASPPVAPVPVDDDVFASTSSGSTLMVVETSPLIGAISDGPVDLSGPASMSVSLKIEPIDELQLPPMEFTDTFIGRCSSPPSFDEDTLNDLLENLQ